MITAVEACELFKKEIYDKLPTVKDAKKGLNAFGDYVKKECDRQRNNKKSEDI